MGAGLAEMTMAHALFLMPGRQWEKGTDSFQSVPFLFLNPRRRYLALKVHPDIHRSIA